MSKKHAALIAGLMTLASSAFPEEQPSTLKVSNRAKKSYLKQLKNRKKAQK